MDAAAQLVKHVNVIDSDRKMSLVSAAGEDGGGDDDKGIFHHAVMLGKAEPIRKLIKTLKIKHSVDDLQMLLDREETLDNFFHD